MASVSRSAKARASPGLLLIFLFFLPKTIGVVVFPEQRGNFSRAGISAYLHTTATFGIQQPYNVTGKIVLPAAGSRTACEKLEGHAIKGKIVLVIRGECRFITKARMAQQAGAIGLIVGDDNPSGQILWRMNAKSEEVAAEGPNSIKIPVVFIQGTAYAEISRQLENQKPMYASLNGTEDMMHKERLALYPHPRHPLMPFVWLMLGLTYWTRRFFYYVARRQRVPIVQEMPLVPYVPLEGDVEAALAASAAADSGPRPRRSAASTEIVNGLTQSTTAQKVFNSTCTICFEDFKSGERVKALPCGHGFHSECIDPWLLQYNSDRCPICNRSILSPPVQNNTQASNSTPSAPSHPSSPATRSRNSSQWSRQMRQWASRLGSASFVNAPSQ